MARSAATARRSRSRAHDDNNDEYDMSCSGGARNLLVDVASACEIPAGSAHAAETPTTTVALFNLDGTLYAVDDACVRCGASLAAGLLCGTQVKCGCGWRYDIATGCVNGVPALCTETFDVKVVDSRVLVATTPLGHSR